MDPERRSSLRMLRSYLDREHDGLIGEVMRSEAYWLDRVKHLETMLEAEKEAFALAQADTRKAEQERDAERARAERAERDRDGAIEAERQRALRYRDEAAKRQAEHVEDVASLHARAERAVMLRDQAVKTCERRTAERDEARAERDAIDARESEL
jgi:fused signal recognition particle receptor